MFHMACYLKEQHGTTSLHTPFLHKIISIYLYIYAFLCNISNCFDNLKHFSASCPNAMQNSLTANGYAKDFHLSSDINAASSGQLQIFSEHIQRYLSLCYPSLSFSAAHVICRQLGFTTVLHIYPIPKNEQLNPILQFSIDCHGYEPVFEECWIINSSQENCSQFVGVQCTDYGTATFAQILLAIGFGGVLIVMMVACVCCYWKRTCKAKKMKEAANRKQTMVKLIEQLAQDTSY